MKTGIQLIEAERERQVIELGYSPGHDDKHDKCEIRRAAECYAMPPIMRHSNPPRLWPWEKKWWKPSPLNRVRELTKAGALYLAEQERQERAGHISTARRMRSKAVRCAKCIDRLNHMKP